MNERTLKTFIRQIKGETYSPLGLPYMQDTQIITRYMYDMTELELTKFAELIIRECDRYVAERFDECEPWMSPGDLLKHFEVK